MVHEVFREFIAGGALSMLMFFEVQLGAAMVAAGQTAPGVRVVNAALQRYTELGHLRMLSASRSAVRASGFAAAPVSSLGIALRSPHR